MRSQARLRPEAWPPTDELPSRTGGVKRSQSEDLARVIPRSMLV